MSQKPSLSASFPACSVVLREFRAVFGEDVQPIYFKEGGREVGKPHDESRYKVIGGKDIAVGKPEQVRNGR
jgi:hypothetical protein